MRSDATPCNISAEDLLTAMTELPPASAVSWPSLNVSFSSSLSSNGIISVAFEQLCRGQSSKVVLGASGGDVWHWAGTPSTHAEICPAKGALLLDAAEHSLAGVWC